MDPVGIDVHQKYSEICTLSGEGKILKRQQIPKTESAMRPGRSTPQCAHRFRVRPDEPVVVLTRCRSLRRGCLGPWLERFVLPTRVPVCVPGGR